jgi:hypothetical protein
MTIRAVDPVARRPLPEGEIGELAVAGYVTPGYYRAPDPPRARLRLRLAISSVTSSGGAALAASALERNTGTVLTDPRNKPIIAAVVLSAFPALRWPQPVAEKFILGVKFIDGIGASQTASSSAAA